MMRRRRRRTRNRAPSRATAAELFRPIRRGAGHWSGAHKKEGEPRGAPLRRRRHGGFFLEVRLVLTQRASRHARRCVSAACPRPVPARSATPSEKRCTRGVRDAEPRQRTRGSGVEVRRGELVAMPPRERCPGRAGHGALEEIDGALATSGRTLLLTRRLRSPWKPWHHVLERDALIGRAPRTPREASTP